MLTKIITRSILLNFTIYISVCFSGCTTSVATQYKNTATTATLTPATSAAPDADSTGLLWKPVAASISSPCRVEIRKNKFKQFNLNYALLKSTLLMAPDQKNDNKGPRLIIALPYPDGSFQSFTITKSNILPTELAAKYPELNAYSGSNINQPAENVRCECTGEGFKAMITTLKGEVLINNCSKKDSTTYFSYYKSDLLSPKKKKFEKPILSK